MKASTMIEVLKSLIEKHGDHCVVSGIDLTGYGSTVDRIVFMDNSEQPSMPLVDAEGSHASVFDMVLSEDSSYAIGGF